MKKKKYMIHIYNQDFAFCRSIEKHFCLLDSSDFWIFFLPPYQSELIQEIGGPKVEYFRSLSQRKYSISTNKYPIFWFFWKDYWFNILVTLKPENKKIIFINISSPPIIEEKALKFMDLSLDLKLDSSTNELNFLNSEEYISSLAKFKYSNGLKKEVSKTIRVIFKLLKLNWFNTFLEDSFIDSLWAQLTTQLNQTKEELLTPKEVKSKLEKQEIEEFY